MSLQIERPFCRIQGRRAFLAGALGTVACNRSKRRIIGVLAEGQTQLFWQSIHAGANSAGRDLGVEIAWNAPPSETDYTAQLQMLEAMMNRRVDAIALCPADKKSMVGPVEQAAKRGIPVVIFDTGIDTDAYVSRIATDNLGAGRTAAERIGRILGGKGRVAIVAVLPGAASTLLREQGFEETIHTQFPDIAIVDKRFGMADFAKSLAVTENILAAHPDLDGIFASNESSTLGAARAIQARGAKAKLVGFDWSPAIEQDLRSGVIDALMAQDPFRIGYDSVATCVKAIRREPVPKIQDLPARLVTRENLDTPEVRALLNRDLKKYL